MLALLASLVALAAPLAVERIVPGACDGVACDGALLAGAPLALAFELDAPVVDAFASVQLVGFDAPGNGTLVFVTISGRRYENRSFAAVPALPGAYRVRIGIGGQGARARVRAVRACGALRRSGVRAARTGRRPVGRQCSLAIDFTWRRARAPSPSRRPSSTRRVSCSRRRCCEARASRRRATVRCRPTRASATRCARSAAPPS